MAKNFPADKAVAIVAIGRVRIVANLVNVDAGALRIGLRVKVVFAEIAPAMNYFCFAPA